MPKLLLPLLALLAIGGSAAGGLYLATRGETVEEVPRPNADLQTAASPTAQPDQPPAKGQLWRWVNVTLTVPVPEPDGSGIYVFRTKSGLKPPSGGHVFEIIRYIASSGVSTSSAVIDAETGIVLAEDLREEDRALFQQVLDTLVVAPLDPATAPWPYNGEPPPHLKRDNAANVSFLVLPPEIGLNVYSGTADPGGDFLAITNGRSTAFITFDPSLGTVSTESTNVLPEDQAVFQQWLATVKGCGTEAAC